MRNKSWVLATCLVAAACSSPKEEQLGGAEYVAAAEASAGGDHDALPIGWEYTAAWNSRNPDQVAARYAEDGSLTINGGTPAVGRQAIAAAAKSYLDAFPDFVLVMDGLEVLGGPRYRYHWTFTGTNTGPGGTGNAVRISGTEEWTLDDEGRIAASIGSYDAADYERQLGKAPR